MRDFLKNVVATVAGLILFSAIGVGGLAILLITASLQAPRGPEVKEDSVLVLDLGLNIQDSRALATPGQALQRALDGSTDKTLHLLDVLEALEQASNDDRIVAIYLKGRSGDMPTNYANLREVREALAQFRETGKPIIAHDRDWNEREYYLASVATELSMAPLGAAVFNGLSAETPFITGTLDQLGIGIQVIRRGDYKSAGETFVRSDYSDENREQLQAYLTDLWSEIVETVSEHRPLSPQEFQNLANTQGVLLPDEAVNQGFVDRIAQDVEIRDRLRELSNIDEDDKSFEGVSLATYIENLNPAQMRRGAPGSDRQIALVYAEGPIVDGEGEIRQIGGDRFAKKLRDLRVNDDVQAVVLRVNSPGGSAIASEVIKEELELLREEKPVIVSMGNVAASGGYWISMAANEIIAQPNTITGSIGVFGLFFNIEDLSENVGLSWDVVQTSPLANTQTISRAKTPEELALLERFVNQIYQRFTTEVSNWRDLSMDEVEDVSQGRIWSGVAAERVGLVDRVGGLQMAIEVAAEAADLGEEWTIQEYPRVRPFAERFLEELFGSSTQVTLPEPLESFRQQMETQLNDISTYNDPRGLYMRLPFEIEIE
ncbi:signal peptide peptidase SppA [Sodalinema gerasimenkoae]|uniref:signal peptide peptidase SppA n=1 Tax=Sodalinema gerasimenkoae TaxID=2862348 RepID=UPI00135B76EA|nr:signal peptide peptidase SppA [Sodalinema gerasimenkoae]